MDSSSEDDEDYEEMRKRLHQLRSQGFHDDMASDLEEEAVEKGFIKNSVQTIA